jgi:hypothetical protein
MRVLCRLNVTDGAVACPHEWKVMDADACRECEFFLEEVGQASDRRAIRCTPEVSSMAAAVSAVLRA